MNILMPQLGETVAEGRIVKWFKRAGDPVKAGDNLFEIETDKTSMEVPATSAGTLTQILFQVGEVAKVGAVVAVVSDGGVPAAAAPVAAVAVSMAPAAASSPVIPAKAGIQNSTALDPRLRGDDRSLSPSAAARSLPLDPFNAVRSPMRHFGPARLPGGVTVTPLARRLAGENGIDLLKVRGSGPHGRIVARDIEHASAERRRAGVSLDERRAEQSVLQLVLTADVEVGALLNIRDEANAVRSNSPVAIRDFVVKAWALSLQRVPATYRASAEDRILPSDQSVIAVAREEGATALVRDAERKTVGAIADEIRDGASQALESNGVSTSVVVLDVPGIRDIAIPVRLPQSTLLAIGAVRRQAVESPDKSVLFASVVTVTLCCDARAVDPAQGARLLCAFKGFIENPLTMLV